MSHDVTPTGGPALGIQDRPGRRQRIPVRTTGPHARHKAAQTCAGEPRTASSTRINGRKNRTARTIIADRCGPGRAGEILAQGENRGTTPANPPSLQPWKGGAPGASGICSGLRPSGPSFRSVRRPFPAPFTTTIGRPFFCSAWKFRHENPLKSNPHGQSASQRSAEWRGAADSPARRPATPPLESRSPATQSRRRHPAG